MALVGGNASLLSDPLVSPLQADWGAPMFTQRRFPAVLIVVGLRETLLSSATMLYRKLVAASQARCVTFSPWEVSVGAWGLQARLECVQHCPRWRDGAALRSVEVLA
jgi:hypothetical protein